jgi:hypothetical protein
MPAGIDGSRFFPGVTLFKRAVCHRDRMTLATILFLSFSSLSCAVSGSAVLPQSAQQVDHPQSQGTSVTQDQSGTSPQKPAEASPPATPAAKPKPSTRKSSSSKKPGKNSTAPKKAADSGCDSTIPADPVKGNSESTTQTNPQDASASQAANPQPPKNCPPEKIVVRQGGVAEQSIQLAGGDQESQKKKDANQMLDSTEENLKKISGTQLSPDQQDTVSQIKQFVHQSKDALAAGDLERGHTLAWKAQLLSEDLIKPQK